LAAELRQALRRNVPVASTSDLRSAQRRTLSMLGWLTGFFGGIWLFGFVAAAPLMTFSISK